MFSYSVDIQKQMLYNIKRRGVLTHLNKHIGDFKYATCNNKRNV